jgi:uncharacterized membrane protein YoaK (UPF0700 family)
LLLLTVVAGWVDALCFLGLGKVFTSFMSGNFLFLGIAFGQGDREFLQRAAAALASFLAGAMASTVLVSKTDSTRHSLCPAVLAAETLVLLAFAAGWVMIGSTAAGTAAPVSLLAVAAFAMGLQAAAVLALNIPGVATNALTGTFTLIARILARRAQGTPAPPEVSVAYLLLLCAAYGLSAGAVVLVIERKETAFLPVILLGIVTVIAGRESRMARAMKRCERG